MNMMMHYLAATTPPSASASSSEDFSTKLAIAVVGILGTLIVALLSAFVGRTLAVRDRRREQYGEAYKTAVEWREMLHRVRRRQTNGDGDAALAQKFHDLHERIAFHEGWIGSESEAMRRAFRTLQTAVRDETREDIQKAWKTPAPKSTEALEPQLTLATRTADNDFLTAVRRHLSWQPWRRVALLWSQRENNQ